MENHAVSILIKWVHLVATAAWIGGMLTNFFVYLPVIGKELDPPATGKLMGAVMKRFKGLVYISIGLFILTGITLGFIHGGSNEPAPFGDSWVFILFIKIVVFTVMVVMVIYSFEILAPRVARVAAKGPSPKLRRIQKSQRSLAMAGFIMGIIILALSAAL